MKANLERLTGLKIYPNSVNETEEATYFLAQRADGKRMGILGDGAGFDGERHGEVLLCPLTSGNAAAVRKSLPWLRPQTLGLQTSAGCGDRLGLATPGHVRAMRGTGLSPIYAQQSMRENARTGRTPQQVIDDATWGVFQEGWRQGYGADADHLKTPDHIDLCVAAGYTFFTIDPGDHVDNAAHTAPESELREKFAALPWGSLGTTPVDLRTAYLDLVFELGDGLVITFTEETLLRAAAKYGGAIAHTVMMYRHLAAQTQNFELEMSVDETETPTSPLEHIFVAGELRRLGVQWVSLAPRYIGRFEKGVDYIGDLAEFEADFAKHAAIARHLGPYKLSIHSGSDKFSIYPIVARLTEGLVHLKTAGTSYLEGVRAIAVVEPALFRRILTHAIERYPEDRATYHVSADLAKVPVPDRLADVELPDLLNQFDARQVLHVTFGSVLAKFGEALLTTLAAHEEAHYDVLEAHFRKHLTPFVIEGSV